jgi:hypothetical protein
MINRSATLAVVPSTTVSCLRFPGFGAGEYEHTDGVCACFRGGPAPRRGVSPGDEAMIAWLTADEAALIWGAAEPVAA